MNEIDAKGAIHYYIRIKSLSLFRYETGACGAIPNFLWSG